MGEAVMGADDRQPATKLEIDTMSAASPDLPPKEATELENSISALGQLVPIVMWRGKVIDGRKRLAACTALGRDPIVAVIPDDASATEYAAALNLLRTHYTASQRAMYASRLATLGRGRRPKSGNCQISNGADNPEPITERAAAKLAGVDWGTIARAKRVLLRAAPEVVAAVDRGDLTLYAAEKVATLVPRAEQAVAAAKVVALKVGKRNMPARALGQARLDPRRMGRAPKVDQALDGFVTQLEGVSEMLDHYTERPLPDLEQCTAFAVRIEKAMGTLRRAHRRLTKEARE